MSTERVISSPHPAPTATSTQVERAVRRAGQALRAALRRILAFGRLLAKAATAIGICDISGDIGDYWPNLDALLTDVALRLVLIIGQLWVARTAIRGGHSMQKEHDPAPNDLGYPGFRGRHATRQAHKPS
jgi:hypothetical protein